MVWGLGLRSRLLVAAGAALLIGAPAPAKAADLGGDCCSDLEGASWGWFEDDEWGAALRYSFDLFYTGARIYY